MGVRTHLALLGVVAALAARSPALADPPPPAPSAPPAPRDPLPVSQDPLPLGPATAIPPSVSVRTDPAWRRDVPSASPSPQVSGAGGFDTSSFLDKPYGAFPLVVPITEPAVGYGAAFMPLLIKKPPGGGRPNLYGAGVLATENGSQGRWPAPRTTSSASACT